MLYSGALLDLTHSYRRGFWAINRTIILLLLMVLFIALPLLFIDLILIALDKLAIDSGAAPMVVLLMFVGSVINIPVFKKPIEQAEDNHHHPLTLWGLEKRFPQLARQYQHRIIAVNLGGAVVPLLLVLYEAQIVWQHYPDLLPALFVAVLLNCIACYAMAKPIKNVGIVIPALFPGLIAALSAMWLAPEMAPPVAFCAGVLGPLIGADLMNLSKILAMTRGVASIGGAGTFDGIVISGLVAVLLA